MSTQKNTCSEVGLSQDVMSDAEKHPIGISILGSCVSRDLFEIPVSHCLSGEYKVERFIQSVNPFSAISPKLDEEIENSFLEQIPFSSAINFYKRCCKLDITKTCFEYLKEVDSDYLIIDVTTARIPLQACCDTYVSSALTKAVFASPPPNTSLFLDKDELKDILDFSEEDFEKMTRLFVGQILNLYPAERVIVLDLNHSEIYLNGHNDIRYDMDDIEFRYSLENKRIDRMFYCLKKFLPNAHYVDRLPLFIGNTQHKWGMNGLHYIDEIYEYLFESIDYIIHNPNKDLLQEKATLDVIKHKWLVKILEKYNETVEFKLKQFNNLVQLENGVNKGEYAKSGVKLVVNDDFTFSLEGTAEEDTVFYLYSKHKNPLGGWISAPYFLAKGKYALSTGLDINKDTFYLQMVLTDSNNNRRWLWGSRTYRFVIERDYDLMLVRVIVNKGVSVKAKGFLRLEKI